METVALVGRFSQAHDRFRRDGFFMADAEPVATRIIFTGIRQIGFLSIANIEEITQHLHFVSLLTFAQQRRDGNAQMLAQQI